MSLLWLTILAWSIEVALGWPGWLYRRIGHPVVWIGTLIGWLERRWNRVGFSERRRVRLGAACTAFVVGLVTVLAWGGERGIEQGIAWSVERVLPDGGIGSVRATVIEGAIEMTIVALIVSSLIASRSLYTHVRAVAGPLGEGDLSAAREAVAAIVGRDPETLDAAGIARASLESLSENASDGVVAPVLYAALFGLPGIAAYKAINTLDSMIGHHSARYACFGRFAARLDDAVNLVPARLTALLILVAARRAPSLGLLVRDARAHRSPNAGWPEAAMAQALSVRLSGPRRYADTVAEEPWLNGAAPDPAAAQLRQGLRVYVQAMGVGASLLLAGAVLSGT